MTVLEVVLLSIGRVKLKFDPFVINLCNQAAANNGN